MSRIYTSFGYLEAIEISRACNRTKERTRETRNSAAQKSTHKFRPDTNFTSWPPCPSLRYTSSRIKHLNVRLREPPRCNDPAYFRAPPLCHSYLGTGDFFSPESPWIDSIKLSWGAECLLVFLALRSHPLFFFKEENPRDLPPIDETPSELKRRFVLPKCSFINER